MPTLATTDKQRAANARWRLANPGYSSAWYLRNKKKVIAKSKAWRLANPIRYRELVRKSCHKRRGFPVPTRPMPEFCEIGGKAHAQKKALCLEHDHATNAFRGWTCHRCNSILMLARDDPRTLFRLLLHVENA